MPPSREAAPYELKGSSPGGHERWERDGYRQWEEYNDWYKYYDNPHLTLHHRGHSSRDRERDRLSPLSRDYSPQGRGRRGREEKGGPPHHPQSSSSSGMKSSTKVLKAKKVKKKKTGEESEPSQQSVDRGDATPVRDEPMDEILSPNKTPPVSSKPQAGTATTKAPTSKSTATPVKATAKSTSKTHSDKTKKEKGQKVKPKVKAECVKVKIDKVKKKTGDALIPKKKDSSSSSSASVVKPSKTTKAKSEEVHNSTPSKKEKGKGSSVRPALLKTPPLPSQSLPLPHLSLHDNLRTGHDIRGRRDLPHGGGLLPLPHQHGLSLLHRPPSPPDGRRRIGEDRGSLLGSPPGKLRRIEGPGVGGDVFSHSHISHQPPLQRLPHPSDRPGLLPLPVTRELSRGDVDRGSIRPLMDLQVGHLLWKEYYSI